MLAAEGALLLLLLRRVRLVGDEFGPLWTPGALQQDVANDVLAGRRAAAAAAQLELQREAAAIGFGVEPIDIPWGYEVQRAHRAAHGLAEGLRRHVELAALDDVEEAARDAVRWASTRAETTAATEAAESWSVARDVSLDDALARDPRLSLELVKVWDAELDKRTCDVCANAHGTIVGIDEDFPDGTPGGVHPRCRCQYHVMTIHEWRSIQ